MTKASTIINKSPRKIRLIIDPIRGVRLDQAIEMIKFMNKGKTKKIYDLLRSAASNGQLSESDYSSYKIGTIFAEEAQRLYRVVPRARGSAFRIRRRYSRVKVELVKQV
ncbi:50S ribosomal protein L22 family protein [Candidatus Gracilibacteria bacterium]|nr:50S ribosomal protein L22 family protein [Thermales bacterium]NJL96308.1 50S ribosomal protein L22 family protein [Candidatus Gracilibacteria bacterium]NJS41566.1 50S ribosomal protein L22 family protein [Candidatus Gracilibacteria bacterium]